MRTRRTVGSEFEDDIRRLPDVARRLHGGVTSDPEGKIAISHDVIGNRIHVADEDGDLVQTLMRDAGFAVQGETVTLPVDEVWVVDPKFLEGLDFEDYVDEEHGLFRSLA
ncbi:hypothetical protein [Microvirga arabica]|nr:hypothetical protein [Microvirga arabica]MBM1175044.1 hypothetical protein [Microvirga arabica]